MKTYLLIGIVIAGTVLTAPYFITMLAMIK